MSWRQVNLRLISRRSLIEVERVSAITEWQRLVQCRRRVISELLHFRRWRIVVHRNGIVRLMRRWINCISCWIRTSRWYIVACRRSKNPRGIGKLPRIGRQFEVDVQWLLILVSKLSLVGLRVHRFNVFEEIQRSLGYGYDLIVVCCLISGCFLALAAPRLRRCAFFCCYLLRICLPINCRWTID